MTEISNKLTDQRYEEIKRIIVDVFKRYGISSVPIDPFDLARRMGITVIAYSSFSNSKRDLLLRNSEDGFFLQKTNGTHVIYYNDEKRRARINNTIMHEIGHIVLGHTEESNLAEAEVNFFAKYALVPPVLVEKLGLSYFDEIEDTFQVSLTAACNALSYYIKWVRYGPREYTDYELELIDMFGFAKM